MRGNAGSSHDVVAQGGAVNRMRERLAHQDVVEWRRALVHVDVDAAVHHADVGLLAQLRIRKHLYKVIACYADPAVDISGLIHLQEWRADLRYDHLNPLFKCRRVASCVVGIGREDHVLAPVPLGDAVRAVAGRRCRIVGPVVTVLLHHVAGNRRRVPVDLEHVVGNRHRGCERERIFVDQLDAQLFYVNLSLVVRLTVLEVKQEPGVYVGHLRVQVSAEAVHPVLGCDRRAVAPHGVLPQMESPRTAVLRKLPAVGRGRVPVTFRTHLGQLLDRRLIGEAFVLIAHRVKMLAFNTGRAEHLLVKRRSVVRQGNAACADNLHHFLSGHL